jgi:hypothetical protein
MSNQSIQKKPILLSKFPLYAVMTRLTPLALGGDKRGKNGYYQVRSLVLPNVKRVEVEVF